MKEKNKLKMWDHSVLTKIFRIMKITLFLIFLGVSQIFAEGSYAQSKKLTLNFENVKVEQILDEIENQSKFYFLYNKKLVNTDFKTSANFSNKKIFEVLDQLFSDRGIAYQVIENQIVLIPEKYKAENSQQQNEVTGTVTDAKTGEPLPGVNITVQGTSTGTVTDANGEYSIAVENPEEATLLFSFVGYQEKTVEVNEREEINVPLRQQTQELEEVVAVGYGSKEKVNLTGSVSQVGSEQLDNRPIGSMSDALQGTSANLNISTTGLGGEPGASKDINIRGVGTLTGNGGEPYVLVDGMPMDLSNVDPNDIKSVSVLKDAAASAIYGARAPYGVILIQTKQGERGSDFTVEYSNNIAWSTPTNIPEQANSLKTAKYLNYANKNVGAAPFIDQETMDLIRDHINGEIDTETRENPDNPNRWTRYYNGHANNDWPDLYYDNWALRQKHNLSLSGGTENTNYYLSAGLYDQEGQMNWGGEYHKRYNITGNVSTDVNDWITVDFNTKYTRNRTRYPKAWGGYDRTVMWHQIMREQPMNPLKSPDGEIINENVKRLKEGGKNLVGRDDLWLKLGGVLEPIEGWKTHINYTWNREYVRETDHDKQVTGHRPNGEPYVVAYPITSFSESYDNNKYQLLNIRSSYEKSLGHHNLMAMVGYEEEYKEFTGMSGSKDNLVTDAVPSISTATGKKQVDDSWSHWATQGIFMRASYNFQEKYLVEFNARYDGSSRFENAESKWGFFPSASVGYNISKEAFWDGIEEVTTMNNLKFRASYGALGNQDVSNYLYIPIMPVRTNLNWIMGDDRPVYTLTPDLISKNLTWETAKNLNLGIDAAFLDNQLNVTYDWYNRTTVDMFGPAEALPSVLGTSPPTKNNAELETKGFDLSVNWEDNITNDLSYDVKLTLSDNQSTVTKYNNPSGQLNTWYEGQKLGEIWGYETAGYFKEGETGDDWHDQTDFFSSWGPGDIKYKDQDGNEAITYGENTVEDPGDKKVIGNSRPRYQFGVSFGVDYKGFDFNMFWQGVGKRDMMFSSGSNVFWGLTGGKWQNSYFEPHMNYWTPEGSDHGGGPDAYYPKPYLGSEHTKNTKPQTKYLQDASYVRLKSLQIGYTLPKDITKSIRIKRARIFVTGENILTITNLADQFDPEATGGPWGSGKTYPLSELYSVGVNVSL